MNSILNRIKVLIASLPTKDVTLGYNFLEKRDFESLKELIDSAVYKIDKNLRSDNPKEYLNIDLEDLNRLKSEVDIYASQLEIPEDSMLMDISDDYETEGFY